MIYKKANAGLAAALATGAAESGNKLTVFIHTTSPLVGGPATILQSLGVRGVTEGRSLFTATLSPDEIGRLGEQPWVRVLELSAPVKMYKPG